MLPQADKDFLTREREQKALFRAQAQITSDISETSSQPAMVEDEEEEEIDCSQSEIQEIDVFDAELNQLPLEIEIKEPNPIVVAPQQNQEQALKLLQSAFEQIKLALLLLNDQKLHQEIETLSQTLAPVAEEPVVIKATETFASKAKKPVAPVAEKSIVIKATDSVAPVAEKPIVIKATKTFASNAKKPVAPVAEKLVVIKATESVAPVAEKPVVIKATESEAPVAEKPVVIKATESEAPVAEKLVASKAKKPVVATMAEKPVATVVQESVAKVTVESFSKNVKDDEEFKVVLPKKSKSKGAAMITAPITVFVEEKNDFPSLGSSFSPVQKTGFWNSGKSSLEIAKSVAQIPSPPPIRSPSLLKTIKARGGSRGPIDEEDDFSDDEFMFQKNREDDDYWQ
jgi:hypothetical protein